MIEGGYYLKARKIQESSIMHAPPHVREIWDWLLMKAMYRNGSSLERGQILTSYDDIRRGLSWKVGYRTERYSKWDCEKAMKWLTKEQMITATKTTRGLVITVRNYDYYQNPNNYEDHTESHNGTTREPQTTATIEKKEEESKKGNKDISAKADTSPKGPGTPSLPEVDNCPHQSIIDLYHEILPSLRQVKEWTEARQKFLRTRWREKPERQSLDYWKAFFEYVSKCPFLMGKSDKPFQADLEWLVRPSNFVKVIEGRYDEKRRKFMSTSSEGIMDWAARKEREMEDD